MINTDDFLEHLLNNGIEKIAGVPCSFLSSLINRATDRGMYVPFTNEGDATAYAAGYALTGKKCAVIMQNSGLSNALSPLSSLNKLFGLNTLLIIGNRGVDDEPQHKIMAGAVKPFLDALKIPYYDAENGDKSLLNTFEAISKNSVAILVNQKDTFSSAKRDVIFYPEKPLRHNILEAIAGCAKDKDVAILTTTGFTSREMYSIKDRAFNFYMVGSMGCLSSLAMGVAESMPGKKVIAIDGDSACLMRLGALYTLTAHAPDNLCYIVLDNDGNESTGNQPNSICESRLFNVMSALHETKKTESPEAVANEVSAFFRLGKYTQIYNPIRMGSIDNLPRPDRELIFNQANRFTSHITQHS
ncbi:MAG: thiamine pyrophosphate-dependent enzyme [Defluviitaleaceae bacterium]|nr:thiamine pyrophosphate-dependent enzyme [Defluviitaleaceae bacterium]